jgi:hypothetical protein
MKFLDTVVDRIVRQEGWQEACSVYTEYAKVLKGSLDEGQALVLDDIQKAVTRMTAIEIETATDTGYKIGRGRITSEITSPVRAKRIA